MQITRATDYAVRVMIHLASLPPGSTVQRSELARVTDVSQDFLSKVLQQLAHSGLIRSQRGHGGGFALAVPALGVTLLDVIEAIEGPVRLNLCLQTGPSCQRKAWCPAHPVWAKAQAAVTNVLREESIAGLAARLAPPSQSQYGLHEGSTWIAGTGKRLDGSPRF